MKTPILLSRDEILKVYKPLVQSAHKGTQGHAVIIAGSYGKMGAAVLSAKACLHSGCGLVTAVIPSVGYQIMQLAVPEVMVITDENAQQLTHIHLPFQPQAVGIGPGIGKDLPTQKAFFEFLRTNSSPKVIDADAINILAMNPTWLSLLAEQTVLTPHPKELERLIGPWISEDDKFQKSFAFSVKYKLIMVIKGAPTYIISPKDIYKNTTGNAALATAGSGDTLTGIITSFIAQGYSPIHAAIIGVYIHGLTADIGIVNCGQRAFVASNIIQYLGAAFLTLDQ